MFKKGDRISWLDSNGWVYFGRAETDIDYQRTDWPAVTISITVPSRDVEPFPARSRYAA